MPSVNQILASLDAAANRALALALVWHGVALVALIALALGWRPTRRAAGALLALPMVSVAAVAFAYHNIFNGALFVAVAVVLFAIAFRLGADEVTGADTAASVAGAGMIAFGLWYPHFLDSWPRAIYFVAAPAGLLPCPTLSLVIGFSLIGRGLDSRAWTTTLVAAGLFYGVFGVARLGVWLDIGLIAGALALLIASLGRERTPSSAHSRI